MASFTKRAVFLGAVVLVGLVLAFGNVVSAAINYEDAFAGVRKTVEATEPQLQQLSKDLREMSTVIPVAATELAGLAETAGALGVPTKNIKEFVRVTAMLGLTTNVTSAQAADALGRLSNILGLTSADYSKFASALVALGNAGASTEAEILEIAKRMGAAGKVAGLTTPQIIGWASALASVTGMEPERAGTSMQMFLLSVTKMANKTGPALALLGKTAGTSAKGFRNLFAKDANAALLRFITGLSKLTKAEKLAVLENLGFTDAGVTRALLGLAQSHAEVARQLGISTKEYERNLAAQAELDKRLVTTKSQLALLDNVLTDVAITLGDALLPVITPMIKDLGKWVKANKPLIAQLAVNLADALKAIVHWISVDLVNGITTIRDNVSKWYDDNKPLVDQLTSFTSGVIAAGLQTIVDVFTKMGPLPPIIAGVTIAVLALNRAIRANPIVAVFFGIVLALGLLRTAWESDFAGIQEKAQWMFKSFSKGYDKYLKPVFDGLAPIINDWVVPAFGVLLDWAGRLADFLWGNDSKGLSLSRALELVSAAFGTFVGVLQTVFGWIQSIIGAAATAIEDVARLASAQAPGQVQRGPGFGPPSRGMGGARAAGGPVLRGVPYKVGEHGDEWFMPDQRGRILPHGTTPGPDVRGSQHDPTQGGDRTTTINITNPAPRAAEKDVARTIRRLEFLGA